MADSLTANQSSAPKQARSKQTKEKIIQAAISLIQQRGYEKTTSNDIAAAAGVSVGSFYTYFQDKRQLLLVIFDRLADEISKNIFESIGPEHLFDSDVRANIRHSVASALDDKGIFLGIQRAIHEMVMKDAEFAERRKAIMQRSISKLRELIALAKKANLTWEVEPDAAAFIVHRVVFDLSQDYITGFCDFDKERAIDALSDMIHRYVFKSKA
ncbi:MAG: TetR/AcrR family transcriptional regulator [Acidobacteria bacterium]|nr:TetR/AcrR family transcriptional regulator [Acidobacteriota bacterium]